MQNGSQNDALGECCFPGVRHLGLLEYGVGIHRWLRVLKMPPDACKSDQKYDEIKENAAGSIHKTERKRQSTTSSLEEKGLRKNCDSDALDFMFLGYSEFR